MEVIGKNYVRLLRQGIESEIPGARQTAQELAVQAIDTIENAGLQGAQGQQGLRAIGQHFDTLLASGIDANSAIVALEAGGVTAETIQAIKNKYPQFFQAGSGAATEVSRGFGSLNYNAMGAGVAQEWFNGFKNKFDRFNFANVINSNISPFWSGQSPPPKGPLHDIDKWGFNVGAAWAGGFNQAIKKPLHMPSLGGISGGIGLSNPVLYAGGSTPPAGGRDMTPRAIHVDVTLSTRDFDDAMHHYRYVQGRTG
jgi:hypothetical protein